MVKGRCAACVPDLFFFQSLERREDPASGAELAVTQERSGRGYGGKFGRLTHVNTCTERRSIFPKASALPSLTRRGSGGLGTGINEHPQDHCRRTTNHSPRAAGKRNKEGESLADL